MACVWKVCLPKKALSIDPYSVTWMKKCKSKLLPDVVGHVPLEISRFVTFFMNRGRTVEGVVADERCYPSPIPKGVLEVLQEVTFTISGSKRRYLERLIDLIKSNYEEEKM